MGWSSLKLTAMLSSIVPTLASLGFAYHGQVSFAQKLTTWAYLLGSAGFVAQGIAEAGLYYASDLFWSGSTERDDASSAESALKHELSKTFDTGRADESTIIEEKMNDLLKYDKNFAVEFLLHHLARERSEFLQKKLARNPEFKPSDLALKEIEGPVTRFLKHFDHVISDEDLLALFHYSGEADAEALLRRRLHV
jgi:hypothetical protein